MSLLRPFSVCLLFLISIACLGQQKPLTNDDVVKMAKGGLGDDLIVQSINAQPGAYQTSGTDLVALKTAGLSDRVIGAMIGKGIPAANGSHEPTAAAPPSVAGVDEVGVYYKDKDGKWVPISPEIVNYKSGGALKSFATNGLIKQDKNGHITGKAAKLQLTRQTSVLMYVTEGTAPEEYLLIKFRVNSDSREFRSQTGGVIHSSTGDDRDTVQFKATKIAPRMYQFDLAPDLKVGEYGILPPGAITSANAASGGKIYTFTVLE
jgi:hypothetical protein